jgi:tRNA pseudouridine38-40 synthase
VEALMRTFRLRVAYDGTDFQGWQRQPGGRTVQGVIEHALEGLAGVPVTLQGAGRTDAGVHARGQGASFRADLRLPVHALRPALAPRLPRDVRVLGADVAADDFDARRAARARRYCYRLLRIEDPLLERWAWRPPRWPDAEALAAATAALEGTHDFSSLRSTGGAAGTPVCQMFHARWRPWEGGLALDVMGDHFLYRMVRTLVGTALRAATLADPGAEMRRVLAARDRAAAGPTVPPQGLCLEDVVYPEVIP